jgi:signal transduction histidine kinase
VPGAVAPAGPAGLVWGSMVGAPFIELFRNFVTSDEGLAFLLRTLEDLPMAVILYDVSGADPEVVYLNRVARPVGIEVPERVEGARAPELFPRSGADQDRWVREAAASGSPIHVSEYETGDRRIWEADVYPLASADQPPTYVLVMGIEVTAAVRGREQARLEREREQADLRANAERIQGLEKVKSDFLNLASHELRGPLAVLRGYLAMLSDGSLGELPPRVRGVLPALNAKAGQMALLINQMLEAARLEDSQLQLKLEPVDMRGMVRRAVDTMGQLTAPGQSILLEGAPDEILMIADAGRVETILVNLLDNALKYSPNGGGVRVSMARADGTVVVRVMDRGIGISSEDLSRLFTRFGRLVTAENSHIPGTGLGLYLSREIARMHGGDITVDSALGEGSAFSLVLPLAGPST